MADEKIVVVQQNSGNTAGILAIVFAILGIFFLGILFVPLAFICAIIATIRAVKGVASKLVAVISWILIIIAFATSPMLLGMLGMGIARQEAKTTKDTLLGLTYSQEFETALKQIKADFSLRGEFRDLKSMTMIRQFKDEALNQKVEVGKPIEYGVGLKSMGQIEFCAQMVLKKSGSKYIIETKNINENKDACKKLHNAELYKKLKTFSIN